LGRQSGDDSERLRRNRTILAQLAPDVQWVESYVTQDKIFCVYMAKDESVVRKHAEMAGFPANKISEVNRVIDPTTATAA